MNTKPNEMPRIYADFMKWDGDGTSRWLILTCRGTFEDLSRLGLQLTEGMVATFYMDDADDTGNSDDLEADGVVHFDATNNHWVAIIDWKLIQHASDRP
jgi:hypothetical protein